MIVVLRDGRTLIGILRSVDQFANLVLHRTIERIHVGKEYGDIPRGVFIIRGENVALLGEIVRCWTIKGPNIVLHLISSHLLQDLDKEERLPLKEVGVEEILEAQRMEQEEKHEREKIRQKRFKELGLQCAASELAHEDAFWALTNLLGGLFSMDISICDSNKSNSFVWATFWNKHFCISSLIFNPALIQN